MAIVIDIPEDKPNPIQKTLDYYLFSIIILIVLVVVVVCSLTAISKPTFSVYAISVSVPDAATNPTLSGEFDVRLRVANSLSADFWQYYSSGSIQVSYGDVVLARSASPDFHLWPYKAREIDMAVKGPGVALPEAVRGCLTGEQQQQRGGEVELEVDVTYNLNDKSFLDVKCRFRVGQEFSSECETKSRRNKPS